jgi:signal transduction histidine kinase
MPLRSHFAKRSLTEFDTLDRLIAAEQDERRRIALFLHDGPVQHLAGIALMIDAAIASLGDGGLEDARSVLTSALERQRETIRELRSLSFALEPVVLRDRGFGPALDELAAQLGRVNGIRVEVTADEAEQIGQAAQIALYTIVRELLEQAIRRGPPTRVDVSVRLLVDGGLETTVADDAEPERRRRSFEVIEERVKQLHGEVAVQAEPGAGTRVVVRLPAYATRR